MHTTWVAVPVIDREGYSIMLSGVANHGVAAGAVDRTNQCIPCPGVEAFCLKNPLLRPSDRQRCRQLMPDYAIALATLSPIPATPSYNLVPFRPYPGSATGLGEVT